MTKCNTIAQCLVNAGFKTDVREAEKFVRRIFVDRFPNDNFLTWNTDIEPAMAKVLIERTGGSSTIHVRELIRALSAPAGQLRTVLAAAIDRPAA